MDIQSFFKHIEEEFDEVKPGHLKPETKFREAFEWNSINALILIAMVKTEYEVTITAGDLVKSKTVQDLFQVIQNRNKE
jgi:acyl carrier protein